MLHKLIFYYLFLNTSLLKVASAQAIEISVWLEANAWAYSWCIFYFIHFTFMKSRGVALCEHFPFSFFLACESGQNFCFSPPDCSHWLFELQFSLLNYEPSLLFSHFFLFLIFHFRGYIEKVVGWLKMVEFGQNLFCMRSRWWYLVE